jgi:hypothetical protein
MQFYDNKQAKELIEDVISWLEKQRILRDHIQAFHQTLYVGTFLIVVISLDFPELKNFLVFFFSWIRNRE